MAIIGPMLVLTDRPERARSWVDVPMAEGPLAAADRELWTAVGGADRSWSARSAPGPWDRLLIVGQAPRSQFDALREVPALPGPVATVALAGTGFHGQRGRAWATERGNLHLCVALPAASPVDYLGSALPMLAAVATVEAIGRSCRIDAGIKWVNDVMVAGAKVGGVLTAAEICGAQVERVVIGVGVNVRSAPRVRPTRFVPAVGCLRAHHPTAEVAGVGLAILAGLARHWAVLQERGPESLHRAYVDGSVVVGRRVQIWPEDVDEPGATTPLLAQGMVRGISRDLSLVVEGHEEPIRRGRLAVVCG